MDDARPSWSTVGPHDRPRGEGRPGDAPAGAPEPGDERPHPPLTVPHWEESWSFQFTAAAGHLAGAVALRLRPAERRAWWWTHVVGPDRALVAVREHDLALPRHPGLELRGSGLWAELTCEIPLDHWSVGLEAFGLAFDDPARALGDERGDPVAVGLDLGWEGTGPCRSRGGGPAYAQPCEVHGQVLVGSERHDVDGLGTRAHRWGRRHWWRESGAAVAGVLDDGTWLDTRLGVDAAPSLTVEVAGASVLGADLEVPGLGLLGVEPLAQAPVAIPGGPFDARAELLRAWCRLLDPATRAPRGWAWLTDLRHR